MASSPTDVGSSQFALWVAFFEIYNESVYDLLQPSFCSKSKKRVSLRVCDDGAGNAYVKGLFGEFGGRRRRRCSHGATTVVCVCRSEVDQHPEPGRSFKTASVWEQKQKRRSYKDEPVLKQEASLGGFWVPLGGFVCESDTSSPSSHSIFTMKLLKIDSAEVKWLSE